MAVIVQVMKRKGRKFYEAYWTDPVTGRRCHRSTKHTVQREAIKFAIALEEDLNSPENEVHALKWSEFVQRVKRNLFPGQAVKTVQTTTSTINLVEEVINPALVGSITSHQVMKLQEHLRVKGVSEFTVKRHTAELRKLLKWALRKRYIKQLPDFDMPRNLGGMKGRPITAEEFERMLKACGSVLQEHQVESWQFLLRGLWWSGLRLGEAMQLHWTDHSNIGVDLSGKRPMFVIQAHAEKARKGRILPMAPEFAELLETVDRKRGYVFRPLSRHGERPLTDWVSKVISKIGESAKVIVKPGDPPKYASAHDLRRAFGFRWAHRPNITPSILMEMMRHESITTTQKFYVGVNAEASAEQIWNSHTGREGIGTAGKESGNHQSSDTHSGDILGDTSQIQAPS